MLSCRERELCGEILEALTIDDLFSLVQTVTSRKIAVTSREEAKKAVFSFTQSLEEFFKRKKISKDVLIKYLYRKGLPVDKDAEKDKLISQIIIEANNIPLSQSSNQICHSINSTAISPVQQLIPPLNQFNYSPSNISVNVNVNYYNNAELVVKNTDQESAEHFVKWFYDMLNSHNPVLNKSEKNFGPQHFWESAQLCLVMNTKNSKVEDIVDGNINVSERLLKFPVENYLLFLPNANVEGVKTKTDPHGLKLILVCGTLHVRNECVGVFQQSFGMVRSPSSPDVWKIKITCLKMDEHSASGLPRLVDCPEIQAIEEHTAKALEKSITTFVN